MKLAVNHYLNTMLVGLAEAVHFADRYGLDLTTFEAAIDAGPMSCDFTRMKLPKFIARDFAVQAATEDAFNSTRLIANAGRAAGIATTPSSNSRARFTAKALPSETPGGHDLRHPGHRGAYRSAQHSGRPDAVVQLRPFVVLAAFLIVLPVFLLILAGWIAGRIGVLGPHATAEINRFVVWLALSALLFNVVAGADWTDLWQPGFIAAFAISAALSRALALFGQFPAHWQSGGRNH